MNANNIFIDTDNYFQNYKPIILEKFISYYGVEYRDLITSRINSSLIDFSSSPIDDFRYITFNREYIDETIRYMIEERYFSYIKLSDDIRNTLTKKFIDFLLKLIQVKNIDSIEKNLDLFAKLFTCCEFNNSSIDSFTYSSDKLLHNPETPKNIKDRINFNRDRFKRNNTEFTFGLSEPSCVLADRIIEERNEILEEYKVSISQVSDYGKKILQKIKNFHNIDLDSKELAAITFVPNSYCGNIGHMRNNEIKWYNYVRVPLTLLLNCGVTSIDTNIIHELIHCIETSGWYVGIESHINGENRISNEIRTQKLALKITEELHKEGIFIFDDPNNYQLSGQSTYEWLFPISLDFFNNFEEIFKDCAIRNDRTLLVNLFGQSWNIYSRYLEEVHNKFIVYNSNVKNSVINIIVDNTYSNLITDMEINYNNLKQTPKQKTLHL